jgi:hypothetical protein
MKLGDGAYKTALERAERAEVDLERCREQLQMYGRHTPACELEKWLSSGIPGPKPDCTCGFSEALERARAALKRT